MKTKMEFIFIIISLILSVLSIIYYVSVISYSGINTSFAWFWLLVGLFFIAVAVLLFIDIKFGIIAKIPKIIRISVLAILTIGILFYGFLISLVLSEINAKPNNKADYLIVLGCQVRGERITKALRFRLDAAIDYYHENPDVMIVVSGGKGTGEDITEALAMQRYLTDNNIPESHIIMEDKATTTKENLEFSKKLIGDNDNIAICSNDFHIYRALALAKKLGYDNPEGLAAKGDLALEVNYIFRDAAAIFKEWTIGNI